MKKKQATWASYVLPIAFGVLFIALWQLKVFHALLNLETYQLPLPTDIMAALVRNFGKTMTDCADTITGALIGMALGSLIGFIVAVISVWFPKWGYGGILLVSAINAIPIVALSPIMNLWFKTGMAQKIGVVTVVCMAAMAFNAYSGLRTVKPFSLDLMQMVAADKWTVFRKLRLPNCLPYVFTAFKINVAASIIAAIISEYFATSTSGLGFGIKDNLRKAEMATGWSYIVVASIAGVVLYSIIVLVEKNAIKWHSSQR
ncbi:ABC transporter permease [Ethanoligenens harbinense]|uniref:Binding-protein-dependent transport systems inner membrane component n=1 Tax=Ethanoligenens harbinense (strain DSM 18485 / JCM 12961 / CGMCC 1.5033 / YUAN-3) TaxID=663278 RepID=E6U512_ETHHY|nr:ABC transporter permease subunit [Ethanoligenens harbinense]ADU26718.1 binding-protein-dependent transport systems inner membrane component [Ethanoligenens harbinense YUAN-3]AVQ95827.1 ABC transporter permease [Ethanoligenens harbinense YUAN-3]AYF38487.1 ABC transporter permease [Ethanoligenens harbinense]AYF41234.1 ABC transporter permease [Ethanoligenens harbinense]QCN92067.1 ABC transporter permease subunit [Ethanoligenens harbinense]